MRIPWSYNLDPCFFNIYFLYNKKKQHNDKKNLCYKKILSMPSNKSKFNRRRSKRRSRKSKSRRHEHHMLRKKSLRKSVRKSVQTKKKLSRNILACKKLYKETDQLQKKLYKNKQLIKFLSCEIVNKSMSSKLKGGKVGQPATRLSKNKLACHEGEIVDRHGICQLPPNGMTVKGYNRKYRKEEDEVLEILKKQASKLIEQHQIAVADLKKYMERVSSTTEAKRMVNSMNEVVKAVQDYRDVISQCAKGNAQYLSLNELIRCMNRKQLLQESQPYLNIALSKMKKFKKVLAPAKTWKRAATYKAKQIAAFGARAAIFVLKKLWEYREYLNTAYQMYTQLGPNIFNFIMNKLTGGGYTSAISIVIQGVSTYLCTRMVDKTIGISRAVTWFVQCIFAYIWKHINVILKIVKKLAKSSSSFIAQYAQSMIKIIETVAKDEKEYNKNVEMASFGVQYAGDKLMTYFCTEYLNLNPDQYGLENIQRKINECIMWLCSKGISLLFYLIPGLGAGDLINNMDTVEGMTAIDKNSAINEEFASLLGQTASIVMTASDVVKDQLKKVNKRIQKRKHLDSAEQAKQLQKYADQNKNFIKQRQNNLKDRAKNFIENTATSLAAIKATDILRKTLTLDAVGLLDEATSIDYDETKAAVLSGLAITKAAEKKREIAAIQNDARRTGKYGKQNEKKSLEKKIQKYEGTYKPNLTENLLETASDWYSSASNYVLDAVQSKEAQQNRMAEQKKQKELLKAKKKTEYQHAKKKLKSGDLDVIDPMDENGNLNIPMQVHDDISNSKTLKAAKLAKSYADSGVAYITSGTKYFEKVINDNQMLVICYVMVTFGALGFAKFQAHKTRQVFKEVQQLTEAESLRFVDLFDVKIDDTLQKFDESEQKKRQSPKKLKKSRSKRKNT